MVRKVVVTSYLYVAYAPLYPRWAVALSLSGALVVDSTAVWALLSGGLLVGVSALLPALAVCASFPVLAWIVLPRVWMGSASRVTAGFTSVGRVPVKSCVARVAC